MDSLYVCMLIHFSHVQLFVTLWTVSCLAPLSMELSRQEHWSGLPYPPPRDLPNPGIELMSLMSPVLARRFFTTSTPWEVQPGLPTQIPLLCNRNLPLSVGQHLQLTYDLTLKDKNSEDSGETR